MANEITSLNAASAIAKLVAAKALPALVGNLQMGALVNRDFEPTFASGGDVVNIPLPPTMVANNVIEAGTVTNQNPSLGNAQIVLDKHREGTFTIPDVTKALASIDLLMTYMDPAVIAVTEAVETDLFNLIPLFTANTAVGGNSAMDEPRIDNAETALFNSKVPKGQIWMALSASAYGKTRQIGRFTENLTYGMNGIPIQTGQLMSVKGMTAFRSQYIPKVASLNYNFVFHRNAIGMAIRRMGGPLPGMGVIVEYIDYGNFTLRVLMSYNPNTLAQQFTIDILYGVAVLRNNHGVWLQSND